MPSLYNTFRLDSVLKFFIKYSISEKTVLIKIVLFPFQFNGRKKLCLFQEGFSKDHYTVLQSLYNPDWYIGFNKKGKPLRGSLYSKSKMQNCFHFLKRDHSYGMEHYTPPGPKIKHPWKLKDLLTGHRSRPQRKVPKTPTR